MVNWGKNFPGIERISADNGARLALATERGLIRSAEEGWNNIIRRYPGFVEGNS